MHSMLSAIWLLGNRQQAMGNLQLELATGNWQLVAGICYLLVLCTTSAIVN